MIVLKNNNIGGVSLADIIQFQTRIMFGAQYGRIEKSKYEKSKDELIIACLRMGWNDAFRHVTKNLDSVETDIKNHDSQKYELEDEFCLKHKKIISHKKGRKEYDDYYSSILNCDTILSTFKKYASVKTTDEKCDIIINNIGRLADEFQKVKENICFGHVQKLFNIAVKLYLCLYMCRIYLNIDDELFYNDIVAALETADCPIDSIILDRFEQKKMKEKGIGKEHELLYPDFTWSQISSDETIDTYKSIQKDFRSAGKSSLYFDFAEWN